MSAASLPATINTDHARLPAVYTAAVKALAECSRVDECQEWADKAAALSSYARQAKDQTLINHAKRVQARAIRRGGELLKQIEPAKGGDRRSDQWEGDHPLITRTDAAESAGLSEHQRKTMLRVATVDEASFDAAVEGPTPPTITELAEWGKQNLKPKIEWNAELERVRSFARFCGETNAAVMAAAIPDSDVRKVRAIVGEIDSWLDTLVVSLQSRN